MRCLLVANRGEIAVRVMRTAHALGLDTVAVYADPDAGAPHVGLADEAVRLPGAAAVDTYLRGDLIIAAAEATGADAIHPGYGFLSENAAFAADVTAAGLTFVGPSPDVIAAMGAKLGAKELMEKAGVPVLPGGEVTGDTDLGELVRRVGLPLLIKASFGGGGRGMRLVPDRADLAGAVASARREATAAFGDGTVFAERYVTDPRHVEVQIVGDSHGTVVHLFERECSIQRRYQKIIEESPSPAVSDDLRAALGTAAVAAGEAIGYLPDGTEQVVPHTPGVGPGLQPSGNEPPPSGHESPPAQGNPSGPAESSPARVEVPLGRIVGARSGDKGGNATVGLWARDDRAYEWLRRELTVDRLRELLTEAAHLGVQRYELPNLRALNFVVAGLLAPGVAATTRPDAQAKALGEYLRSRVVSVPRDVAEEVSGG